jgi:stalled ribosome rescue protein Dom34
MQHFKRCVNKYPYLLFIDGSVHIYLPKNSSIKKVDEKKNQNEKKNENENENSIPDEAAVKEYYDSIEKDIGK